MDNMNKSILLGALIAQALAGCGGSNGNSTQQSSQSSSVNSSFASASEVSSPSTSDAMPSMMAAEVVTTTNYLFENAARYGNVVLSTSHLNYLGQGFAANFWGIGDGATFTVNASA